MTYKTGDIEHFKSKLTGEELPWIYLGNGKWRRLKDYAPKSQRKAPAFHDPNYFQDGTFKYNTHGRNDRGAQPCIEDLGNEHARESWHNYVVTNDPRTGERIEGPAPFRNSAEKREYMRLYGYREADKGERTPHPLDQARARFEQKRRRRR